MSGTPRSGETIHGNARTAISGKSFCQNGSLCDPGLSAKSMSVVVCVAVAEDERRTVDLYAPTATELPFLPARFAG